MKRFNFNNKPMVESPYPPQDTNVLWVDVDEGTGKVSSISRFNNGTWKIILLKLTGDMYKIYVVRKKDISNCTYNMVDLGLPSGLKWADRNVGATSPEDYGSYFQWGDTNAYTFDGVGEVTAAKVAETFNPILGPQLGMEITADNVGMILEQMGMTGTDLTSTGLTIPLDKKFNWESYFDTDKESGYDEDGNPISFKKYNNEGGLTVLESEDDAATVHMGSKYRTPTVTEMMELMNNTTQTFIDIDGNEFSKEQAENAAIESGKLKGVKFISSNGNNIFIPSAGNYYEYMSISGNSVSTMMSSSLTEGDKSAWSCSCFYSGTMYAGLSMRCGGYPVRGVQS